MARKRTTKRSQSTGCLGAIFGLIGGLVKALVSIITGFFQLLASIAKWLNQQKVTLPIRGGYQVSGLLIVAFLCSFCMCCSMAYVGADIQLRSAGILPTYTPLPSPTPSATSTSTPIQTPTLAPTLTATPEPTNTLMATNTPEINQTPIVAASEKNVNMRSGPGTNYDIVGTLSAGQSLEIVGRNADSSWWQVSAPDGLCWVSADVVTASNVDDTIPVVKAPPPPVQPIPTEISPQPTPTPTPRLSQPTEPPASTGPTFTNDEVDPPWWPCAQGQIKGNRDSMIYHEPGGQYYAKTYEGVECFNTPQEAEAAGYRASKR